MQEVLHGSPFLEHPVNSVLEGHERRISHSLSEGSDSISTPRANAMGRIGECDVSTLSFHFPFLHLYVSFNFNLIEITSQIGFMFGRALLIYLDGNCGRLVNLIYAGYIF